MSSRSDGSNDRQTSDGARRESDLSPFLAATPIVDSDSAEIRAFSEKLAERAATPLEAAVRLYYAVRDDLRYDPYTAVVSVEGLRASSTLSARKGWCVAKAVVLAACCRAIDVPARLGFADVRNHLSTERMRASMNTDVFYWHGYTSIWLEGKWVKATPAFNIELCDKFGFLPLEFDGRDDSIYHPFDREGKQHMEYVHERGEFADVPLDEILATFRVHYPDDLVGDSETSVAGDFEAEVEAEIRGRAANADPSGS